jgi:hypothetical protein
MDLKPKINISSKADCEVDFVPEALPTINARCIQKVDFDAGCFFIRLGK